MPSITRQERESMSSAFLHPFETNLKRKGEMILIEKKPNTNIDTVDGVHQKDVPLGVDRFASPLSSVDDMTDGAKSPCVIQSWFHHLYDRP